MAAGFFLWVSASFFLLDSQGVLQYFDYQINMQRKQLKGRLGMKTCDACGKTMRGCVGVGGAILCRSCAPDVRQQIGKMRSEGKIANAMGIARKMFRETHSACNYTLRDIPKDLMDKIRDDSYSQGISMREWILRALRDTPTQRRAARKKFQQEQSK